ncbi:MAG: hypothetical protein ACKN94_14660, partial [Pirellulaceae bacterium]
DANDSPTFTKINEAAAKTDDYGFFWFRFADPTRLMTRQPAVDDSNKEDEKSHPAALDKLETPTSDGLEDREDLEEFRKRYPHLLPNVDQRIDRRLNFAFKVTAMIEEDGATQTSLSTPPIKILEVLDERTEPGRDWGRSLNLEGTFVPEDALFVFRRVRIPASNTEAAMLAGDTAEKARKPALKQRGNSFAFLGVGRATWDEIGGFAETRPEFIDKTGYFRSANTWKTNPDNLQSRLPDRYDAPFAGYLEIQGLFGGDLIDKPLYYSVTLSRYTGDLSKPFDPTFLSDSRPVARSCSALFFEYLSTTTTDGRWKSEGLGPYSVTIDGKPSYVYRRRLPRATNVEYWTNPTRLAVVYAVDGFSDLGDGLWVMTIRAFERIGGTETAPSLQEIPLEATARTVMALVIDRSKVRLRFDKIYPADPSSYVKLQLVACTWDSGGERYSQIADVTECNEVEVTPGQVGGNEGILVQFTICDWKGEPHKSWKEYKLTTEYTPRSTSDSPDKKTLNLRRQFAGTGPLDQEYRFIKPFPSDPTTPVSRRLCVLVPVANDGWPPEKGDPHPTPCVQYGVGLQLEALSRQIDGSWETYYLPERTARYIVLRSNQAGCS